MSDTLNQGKDEEQERLQGSDSGAGTEPDASSVGGIQSESANPVKTPLGNMTLSMFEKGQYVRVRVGSLHNATELYEHAYESADEANTALLEAGILNKDQVPDPLKLAGTGIELSGITAEQLEAAGLKRHIGSSL